MECESGTLDGVLVICDRAPSSIATTGRYDQELIQALPPSVKFICHNGKTCTSNAKIGSPSDLRLGLQL